MTLEEAKSELMKLLNSWEKDEAHGHWHMLEGAEMIEDKLFKAKLIYPHDEANGLAIQVANIVEQLSIAQHQCVLPVDIKVMKSFLSECEANVRSALLGYLSYWNLIDYSSRESEAQKYWFR